MDGAAACNRCGKPLEQLGRGRPRLYCGDSCRKGAQRDRDRSAAAARKGAEQRAAARAAAARAWRSLEGTRQETAGLAAEVLTSASGGDISDLTGKIGELRAAVDELARLALAYADASKRASEDRPES